MDSGIIIVLAASVFILCLLLFLFSFVYKYQKKTISFVKEKKMLQTRFEQVLLQSQVEVQESTYKQIASELHDNIGQLLSTTKMLMAVTELKWSDAPDTLQTASNTLAKAIQEIRGLSRSLDPEWLQQFNFLENLKSEVERINAGKIIEATIEYTADIDMRAEEQIILFRIIQEAIQNAVRHAKPSFLIIRVLQDAHLVVEVQNDGLPLPTDFHGMGTSNMRYRTQLLGGIIHWSRTLSHTLVSVQLPLKKDQ